MKSYDLLVVGGGINGVGIARDAAGRGLSVALCEAGDLGGATSSASSKLIHGGLRYLEYLEFRLVRKSLREREILLAAAPHIIWPLRFILPHHKGLRPAWLLRLGLFLYDHIGGRKKLAETVTTDLRNHPAGKALKPAFTRGFEYSDCWVQDARLVVLNALDAAQRGADILPRTRLTGLDREGDHWLARLESADGHTAIHARAVVNAAGPWVADVLRLAASPHANQTPRLVKGSHIIVPRLHEGPQAFTCQGADGRVVFAIPYEQDFTLIGTTDEPFTGDPRGVAISPEEIHYLCKLASEYFAKPITPADVVWTYSGVRPLFDSGETNASAVTRDYVFQTEGGGDAPILLSIYGGKLTTYRLLADHVLRDLSALMPIPAISWTAAAPLPGGDFADGDFERFLGLVRQRWPWLPERIAWRLARNYGTCVADVLGDADCLADLGQMFAAGLTEAELVYLRTVEWAQTADDVLWRRSKLGLHMMPDERQAVADWFSGLLEKPDRSANRRHSSESWNPGHSKRS
jgi:glycerol-3-phosphate dehydrogenase